MISLYNKLDDILCYLNYKEFHVGEDLIICVENKIVFEFPVALSYYYDYNDEYAFIYKTNNETVDYMNKNNLCIFMGYCGYEAGDINIRKNKELVYNFERNDNTVLEDEIEKIKKILQECNIKI